MNRKIAYAAVAIIFLGLVGGITGNDEAQEQAATAQVVEIEEKEETPIQEETTPEYQDKDWAIAAGSYMQTVGEKIQKMSDAAINENYPGVDLYAGQVKKYSGLALENSQQYKVSPDLEPVKSEYELTMECFYDAADCAQQGVQEHDNGNEERSAELFLEAIEKNEEAAVHLNIFIELLNERTP